MSRRFSRPPQRLIALGLMLLALLALRLMNGPNQEQEPTGSGSPPVGSSSPRTGAESLPAGDYRVSRAVDGDTLLLENRARIRLIGVNAPETVKPDHRVERWGPEASAFTKAFISGGTVRLEFDRERFDQYGRYLAYVWVGDRMLNEELARAGLARWEPQYHYSESKKRLLRQAEKEARQAKRGIWSDSDGSGASVSPHGRARQLVSVLGGW